MRHGRSKPLFVGLGRLIGQHLFFRPLRAFSLLAPYLFDPFQLFALRAHYLLLYLLHEKDARVIPVQRLRALFLQFDLNAGWEIGRRRSRSC